jgi:hypothetical protein
VGRLIADCQLQISDWSSAIEPIGNWQSEIENPNTTRLPRGGTDLMSLRSFGERTVIPFPLFDSNQVPQLAELLITDASHHHQMLRAAKQAVLLAMSDNALADRLADAR